MAAYLNHRVQPETAALLIAALMLATMIGFGLGASVDLQDRSSVPEHEQSNDVLIEDWHGNVKRSQGR